MKKYITALGFTSLLTQVFLIREAGVWLKGNEFIIAVIVAAWLAWTATGSLLAHKFVKKNPRKYFFGFWFAAVVAAVLELIALNLFWSFSGDISGEIFDLIRAAGAALALTALPCLFYGAAFGAALNFYERRGAYSAIKTLYLLETLGAVAAGIFVTVFIYAAAYFEINPFNKFSNKISEKFLTGKIAVNKNLPLENITITERGGEAAFYLGGRLVGSSRQKEFAEEVAGYSSLLAPKKKNALLIGFPYNGLAREMVEKGFFVTIPEQQKQLPEIIEKYLLPEDRNVLTGKNVKIVPTDARVFAANSTQKFDVIIQNVGIPEAYSVARLYSKEWFDDLSKILKTNGVFTVVLPGSAGYVPDDLARVISRVSAGLKSEFKFTALVPASSTLLLASNGIEIPMSPALWIKKMNGEKNRWFNQALIEDNLNFYRVAQFTNACARFGNLKIQTDDLPVGYGDALLYSEARFYSVMKKVLAAVYNNPKRLMIISIFCISVWLFIFFVSRGEKMKLWMTMTIFALAGFVGEMTAMIRFTIACGNLFFAIGLLFAGFMLGLAIAVAMNLRKNHRIPITEYRLLFKYFMSMISFQSIALAIVVFISAVIKIPNNYFIAIVITFLLNFLCGYFVGSGFAILSERAEKLSESGIIIYAADLIGAMIGAVLFSIIIPPVLGFTFLAIACAVVLIGMLGC